MMMRTWPGEALVRPEIMMLGRVRMAGEAHRVRTPGQELQERARVDHADHRVLRVEIGAQRNVHADDDEFLSRDLAEEVGDEGELPVVEAPLVFAFSLGREGSPPR